MDYLAIIKKYGNGYSAYIPDIPGCISAASTKKETLKLLKEELIIHLHDCSDNTSEETGSKSVRLSKDVKIITNPS